MAATGFAALIGVEAADEPLVLRPGNSAITRKLLEDFRYDPAAFAAAEAAKAAAIEATDPDRIRLPEFTVVGAYHSRELDKEIARQAALRDPQKLSWKGGPLLVKDIGRVRFGVYSVFYVPVLIGFSW